MDTAPQLGTSAELPADYRARLADLHVLPAWTLLRAVMPVGAAVQKAVAFHWPYARLREELLRAGDLVPVEKAERRVLALINPGLNPDSLATLPSIFFGLQLIRPGERAPNHKHIPAAVRVILEGSGAYTTVEGEKLAMEPGDLILTPPNHWHDHGHEGRTPMIWMDVLDHPLAVPLDISYVTPGKLATFGENTLDAGDTAYRCAGVAPYRPLGHKPPDYPLRRYRWSRVREALAALAEANDPTTPVHLRYINPETGDTAIRTLDFSARELRPGESVAIRRSSANRMFPTLEGEGVIAINGAEHACAHGDAVAVPTYASVTLTNAAARAPWRLLQVDDTPTQTKLGFYEEPAV